MKTARRVLLDKAAVKRDSQRDKAKAKLEQVQAILGQYHDGLITGTEADHKLVELLLNATLDR